MDSTAAPQEFNLTQLAQERARRNDRDLATNNPIQTRPLTPTGIAIEQPPAITPPARAGSFPRLTSIPCPRLPHMSDKTYRNVQLTLLVGTLATIIIGSIPPLSFVGSITMRAITTLSLMVFGYHYIPKETTLVGKAGIICLVVSGILGLAALCALSPVLMIASIAMDVAYRAIEMSKNFKSKNWAMFAFHATFLVIDVLCISAIAAGSWQLMLAAAACNLAAITVFLIIAFVQRNKEGTSKIDLATLAVGFACALSSFGMAAVFVPPR